MDESERIARLETLFYEHATAVRAYALRRTSQTNADDAVMEVFVIACRRLEDVPRDPLPWLIGCARRVLANQRRGAKRADALVERISGSMVAPPLADGSVDELKSALASLEERDREVLFLSAWENLEPAEIAQVLGCSGVAARVRLHRARERLAAAVERNNRHLLTRTAEVPR